MLPPLKDHCYVREPLPVFSFMALVVFETIVFLYFVCPSFWNASFWEAGTLFHSLEFPQGLEQCLALGRSTQPGLLNDKLSTLPGLETQWQLNCLYGMFRLLHPLCPEENSECSTCQHTSWVQGTLSPKVREHPVLELQPPPSKDNL